MSYPTLGQGATLYFVSDRVPCTVTRVTSPTKIWVRRDEISEMPGQFFIGAQPDLVYTRRKNGVWVQKGDRPHNSPRLVLGSREYYRDPSF